MVQCWPTVYYVGPTLNHNWVKIEYAGRVLKRIRESDLQKSLFLFIMPDRLQPQTKCAHVHFISGHKVQSLLLIPWSLIRGYLLLGVNWQMARPMCYRLGPCSQSGRLCRKGTLLLTETEALAAASDAPGSESGRFREMGNCARVQPRKRDTPDTCLIARGPHRITRQRHTESDNRSNPILRKRRLNYPIGLLPGNDRN